MGKEQQLVPVRWCHEDVACDDIAVIVTESHGVVIHGKAGTLQNRNKIWTWKFLPSDCCYNNPATNT